ncbi:MAG: PIN domain nuclease [Candidatus Binataceae bacterium]
MIVVDSSVWIDYFNGRPTAEADALERLARAHLVIGDLIMAEVLQGFSAESDFRRAQRIFAALEFRPMVGREIAIAAARNHRALRARGVTVRKTIDTIIATFCITEGHDLLHCDRDFDPFQRHLGLRVVRV